MCLRGDAARVSETAAAHRGEEAAPLRRAPAHRDFVQQPDDPEMEAVAIVVAPLVPSAVVRIGGDAGAQRAGAVGKAADDTAVPIPSGLIHLAQQRQAPTGRIRPA